MRLDFVWEFAENAPRLRLSGSITGLAVQLAVQFDIDVIASNHLRILRRSKCGVRELKIPENYMTVVTRYNELFHSY